MIALIEANEANETEHKRPELIEAKPFVEDETTLHQNYPWGYESNYTRSPQSSGVEMDSVKDEFVLDFEKLISVAKTLTFTKRNLLRLMVMFFDPIRFISPVIIEMKIVLQKITVLKLGLGYPLTRTYYTAVAVLGKSAWSDRNSQNS